MVIVMNKKYFGDGSKINQIMCAVILNIATFAYGSCVGWMSPMGLLLQSEDSPTKVPLADREISWMAATPYLVNIPANYFMAFLGDSIGRKWTIIFMSASSAALWAIKLSSLETWALVLSRCLVGICMSGSCIVCPTYLKEISENTIRGALATSISLFFATGTFFSFVIGDILSYYHILWISLTIPVAHIVLFMLMPESPSFLIKQGKIEEAASAMAWLRCRKKQDLIVQQELELIRKELMNDEESSTSLLKNIFADKILLRAFGIAMMVALAREICGAITVLNFASNIFSLASKDTSLILSPNQEAMLLGAVQIFGTLLGSSIIEVTGRKPLLVITSSVSGICMCALASWFLAQSYGIVGPTWLPATSLCFSIFCDACGLMPMGMVITAEIFSYKYRGSVLAVTMTVASLMDFVFLILFKTFASSTGVYYIFYFFGLACILNAIYVTIIIPETKKKSLEEIYEALKTKDEKE